ncbi:MAG TPA: CHC2 zinc finger domain-containing protein, partial [Actinomycetes bacterium]|nr:CHC2 zinc finger domain-containing protein [Actinomycetes bacterium]
MAGRIRNDDVARVRDMAGIAEVVGDHVTLRPAGGGSLKGLCPFHEERSPSFHVTPAKGLYHCFGCQVGGDVIDFLERIEHLTFQEAVEKLAGRFGVELRYEDSGAGPRRPQGERTRLLEAHKAAAAYYAEQLTSAEA